MAFSCLGKADGSPASLTDLLDVISQWRKHYEHNKAQLQYEGFKADTGNWPGLKQARVMGGISPETCKAAVTRILRYAAVCLMRIFMQEET